MPATAHWKLTLAYDGTSFHGWQIQPGLSTIQGTLSESIARLTGERVLPQGSGRTDAGVHALAQVCSFPLAAPIPPANLQCALNRILPAAIRILSAEPVPPTFHARHSAVAKTYEYRIFERRPEPRTTLACHPDPEQREGEGPPHLPLRLPPVPSVHPAEERLCSPFLAPFVCDCRWPLSLDRMQQAADLLLGTHDFTSFAAADPERSLRAADDEADEANPENPSTNEPHKNHPRTTPNPQKTITFSRFSLCSLGPGPWTLGPPSGVPDPETRLLLYRITGSGFLHHMVRNLVGTLIEIGRNSLEINDLCRILEAKDRSAAGPTAPARGLFLAQVHYNDPKPPGTNN